MASRVCRGLPSHTAVYLLHPATSSLDTATICTGTQSATKVEGRMGMTFVQACGKSMQVVPYPEQEHQGGSILYTIPKTGWAVGQSLPLHLRLSSDFFSSSTLPKEHHQIGLRNRGNACGISWGIFRWLEYNFLYNRTPKTEYFLRHCNVELSAEH